MEKRIRNFAFLTSRGCGTSRDTYFSQISVSTFSPLGKNTCFLHLLNFMWFFFPMWQMMKMNYYAAVGTLPGSLTYRPPETECCRHRVTILSPGVVPFFCVTQSRSSRITINIHLTTLSHYGLHAGDENYHTFLKTRTPKKSPTDEIHSLSLPARPPKAIGLLK